MKTSDEQIIIENLLLQMAVSFLLVVLYCTKIICLEYQLQLCGGIDKTSD